MGNDNKIKPISVFEASNIMKNCVTKEEWDAGIKKIRNSFDNPQDIPNWLDCIIQLKEAKDIKEWNLIRASLKAKYYVNNQPPDWFNLVVDCSGLAVTVLNPEKRKHYRDQYLPEAA